MNYSPLIYAFEQENIAITGRGTLDGSAAGAVMPTKAAPQRWGNGSTGLTGGRL